MNININNLSVDPPVIFSPIVFILAKNVDKYEDMTFSLNQSFKIAIESLFSSCAFIFAFYFLKLSMELL